MNDTLRKVVMGMAVTLALALIGVVHILLVLHRAVMGL
jgi:hypothetical protein